MPVNLGHIFATLGLDTKGLGDGAKEAEGRLNKMDSTLGGVQKKLVQLGVAAAVAGAGIVAALVKTGMDAIDAQNDLARSLDTNVNALRALQIAASEAGVDSGMLNKALQMMSARLGEAKTGTGEAYKALKMLGLSAQELSELDADDRMAAIADRVRELGLAADETANLLRDFGIRGGAMVDLLRQGGDTIRSAAGDVRAFGLELTKIDVAMVDQAKESISRMGLVMEGVRNKVTVALAPILGELADRFNNAAKASGGFGDEAVSVLHAVAKGVAFVGNVIQGVRVAFKVAEVGVKGLAGSIGTAIELITEGFTAVSDAVTTMINLMIRGINKFGGSLTELPLFTDSPFMKSVRDGAESMRMEVGATINDLRELAMQSLPTEKVDEFFAAVEKRRREMAEQELASRNEGGDSTGVTAANPELEAKRKALAEQLDAVRQYGMDEYQLLNDQLQKKMDLIRESVALRVLTESDGQQLVANVARKFAEEEQAIGKERMQRIAEEAAIRQEAAVREFEARREFALADEQAEIEDYERRIERVMQAIEDEIVTKAEGYARLEEMEQAHMDRVKAIREAGMNTLTGFTKASFAMQTKYVAGQMADMTAGVARESKAMFEINKVAGIANATIFAAEGIANTLRTYPYPLSVAMAALQAVAAFAQVRAISSQSFSKGSAAPSLSGGTPAPPVTPVTGGTPQSAAAGSRLFVEGIDPGALFSGRQMREIVERLIEHQRDGGTVVLSG